LSTLFSKFFWNFLKKADQGRGAHLPYATLCPERRKEERIE